MIFSRFKDPMQMNFLIFILSLILLKFFFVFTIGLYIKVEFIFKSKVTYFLNR